MRDPADAVVARTELAVALGGTRGRQQPGTAAWRTPWIWPGRPGHDLGAALCASLAFAAGAALIALGGPRE